MVEPWLCSALRLWGRWGTLLTRHLRHAAAIEVVGEHPRLANSFAECAEPMVLMYGFD
jgi:hypothetical protein